MRFKKLLLSLLVISVFLYLVNVFVIGDLIEFKARPESNINNQDNSNEVLENEPESRSISPQSLSNDVNGWGFKKVSDHKTPEITSGQASLIKKYDVLFVTDEKKKEVVLTFDLGYEEGYTEEILDTLKKHKVPVTFFVTGAWLTNQNPKVDCKRLVKRMVKEGHIVGNHSWSHPSMPTLDESKFNEELKKIEDLIVKESGQSRDIKFFRPPKGEFSERTLYLTNELGYKTTLWSIALVDWLPMPGGSQEAIDGVVNNLHNGAVILLHGKSKDVVQGLDEILKQIKSEGYKIVPLSKQVKNK